MKGKVNLLLPWALAVISAYCAFRYWKKAKDCSLDFEQYRMETDNDTGPTFR